MAFVLASTSANLTEIVFVVFISASASVQPQNQTQNPDPDSNGNFEPFLVQVNNADTKFNSSKSKVLPVETATTTTTTELPRTQKSAPAIWASTCPESSTISPCTCTKDFNGLDILCRGSAVDQRSVENSFREIRRVNGISEDRGILIDEFSLLYTELTRLDLAPLYKSQMKELQIEYNRNLRKLVTSGTGTGNSGGQDQFIGSIHVDTFSFGKSPMKREGFGDALKYLSGEMTTFYASELDLSNNNPNKNNKNNNNNNNTEADEFELIPGLFAFTNLTKLTFDNCKISGRLTNSHFQKFSRLEKLSLGDNKIDGIGENVFPSTVSYIYLWENKLNETSFHPDSGITRAETGRKMVLDLEFNKFTTLPSEIFQPFLDAHPENRLWLESNPLICDERLGWLKSSPRRYKFQVPIIPGGRFNNPECSNDRGHTIFDSNLIPSNFEF